MGIVKVCGKITGVKLNDPNNPHKVRSLKKAQSMADRSHPLFDDFVSLPSGHRYSLLKCRTNRRKK